MQASPELLSLLAAACWAVGSLFSAAAAVHLGAFAFTRWRLTFALSLLGGWTLLSGGWRSLDGHAIPLLAVSGLIGIFLGDTALFACMNRLGPRRSGVLFATHALFSAVLAWFWLGETLWGRALAGSVLLVAGVMVAITWGKREGEQHAWELTRGKLLTGVVLGLLAALGQSVATLMIKPLMASGVDAIAASAVRLGAALLAHLALLGGGLALARAKAPPDRRVLANTAASAAIAMAMGMTLVLQALKYGPANLVGIFSSVTPVLLLPLLWAVYRRRPAAGAWWGAGMAVAGSALILAR